MEKKGKGFWTNLFHKLRAICVFLRIVLLVGFNCVVTFPTSFELVLAALSIFNLDILPALGIDCWLTKFKLHSYDDLHHYRSNCSKLAIFLLFDIISNRGIPGHRHEESKSEAIKFLRVLYFFLLLTFYFLIGTSISIIHFLKCHEFVLPKGGESERYLYKDYSIDCNSNRYQKMVPFAITIIIIYPVGAPLLHFVLLWEHRQVLSNE